MHIRDLTTDDECNLLTPSLIPYQPQNTPESPVVELEEFAYRKTPFLNYINNLYVYPLQLQVWFYLLEWCNWYRSRNWVMQIYVFRSVWRLLSALRLLALPTFTLAMVLAPSLCRMAPLPSASGKSVHCTPMRLRWSFPPVSHRVTTCCFQSSTLTLILEKKKR